MVEKTLQNIFHLHFLDINVLSTLLTFIVLNFISISPRLLQHGSNQSEGWMRRSNPWPPFLKSLKTITLSMKSWLFLKRSENITLSMWNHDYFRCGLSMVLGCKSKGDGKWGFFSHGCVEGHLLCLLKGGQIWSNCFCFTFNLDTYGQWNNLVFSKWSCCITLRQLLWRGWVLVQNIYMYSFQPQALKIHEIGKDYCSLSS